MGRFVIASEIRDRFEEHRDSVYRWAYRILGDHHDALDATQEVFVKWWSAWRDRDAPEHPVGWLRRVTINHSINVVRGARRRSTRQPEQRPRGLSPLQQAERSELADAVVDALDQVSDQQRAVLFAKVYDHCTFAEIAAQMNLAVPTVKTHYLRALRGVRRSLVGSGMVEGAEHEL